MQNNKAHDTWERKAVLAADSAAKMAPIVTGGGHIEIFFYVNTLWAIKDPTRFFSFFWFSPKNHKKEKMGHIISEIQLIHPDWKVWWDAPRMFAYAVRTPKAMQFGYLTSEVRRIIEPIL